MEEQDWWTDGRYSGRKVLIVDDIEMNRELLSFSLEDADIEVLTADNGQQAIDIVFSSKVDLVLMDIEMPIMNGLDATQKIRENNEYQQLPIIAMTGHSKDGDREKTAAVGMNDHLVKPIDPEDLFQVIKQWF